jgi:hypothetical protein
MTTNSSPKKPWTFTDVLYWGFGILSGIICLWGLVGFAFLLYQVNGMYRTHHFDSAIPVPELTQEEALSYAHKAMLREGLDLADWEQDKDQAAPNTQSPSQTKFLFIHKKTRNYRNILVDNQGKSIAVTIQKSYMD